MPRPANLLIIDDDDVDRMILLRALRKQRVLNPVFEARDAAEGLSMLREPGAVPEPRVVLLDLEMPGMDGRELLQTLRADPELHRTVVFVLTSSAMESDRAAAWDLNVAGYIVKANAGDDFVRLVELLDLYWRVVALP